MPRREPNTELQEPSSQKIFIFTSVSTSALPLKTFLSSFKKNSPEYSSRTFFIPTFSVLQRISLKTFNRFQSLAIAKQLLKPILNEPSLIFSFDASTFIKKFHGIRRDRSRTNYGFSLQAHYLHPN